jgi:hypothetical protein
MHRLVSCEHALPGFFRSPFRSKSTSPEAIAGLTTALTAAATLATTTLATTTLAAATLATAAAT